MPVNLKVNFTFLIIIMLSDPHKSHLVDWLFSEKNAYMQTKEK